MPERWVEIAKGRFCRVYLTQDVLDALKGAPAKDTARVLRILEMLSSDGQGVLNEEMLKAEGRYNDANGKEMMVYAVKSYQLRIYGGWDPYVRGCFRCSVLAIKKQNKADKKLLKKAATFFGV